MGSQHQTRKDIDKLYTDLYNQGLLQTVLFKQNSTLQQIYYENEDDKGTLDAILNYYQLITLADRVLELENKINLLENRIEELENGIE